MDDRPIDLAALDPTLDGERWERRIAAISALAAPQLARRAAAASPAQVLVGWFRPALAMAAALALCAGAALMLQLGNGASAPAVSAEALRLPSPVSQWLGEDQPPTMAEVAAAVGGGQP